MDKTRYTIFLIIALIVGLVGCRPPEPMDAISQQERFIRNHPLWKDQASEILDKRSVGHEYKQFPFLQHGDKHTIYCKTHFMWEIVSAFYNSDNDSYDYFVVKHPKEKL